MKRRLWLLGLFVIAGISLTVAGFLSSCSRPAAKPTPANTEPRPANTEYEEIKAAIQSADTYSVEHILMKNPKLVEVEDAEENTLLHMAVWKGDIRIVRLFIEYKTDLNAQNKWGFTALHELARKDETNETKDIANLLILYGAKVNLLTGYGNTPLDIAEIKGRTELIRILRSNGGKRNKHSINLPPVPEFARDNF